LDGVKKERMPNKVIVTGASGLLGRAIVKTFAENGWEVTGLTHSRSKEGDSHRQKCDLTVESQVRTIVKEVKPDVIIHCMAERRPDKVDADPEKASLLNVTVTDQLSKISSENGSWFIFISTDYVFDGKHPPYATNAETNPVNSYGKLKRDAELVVWKNQSDAGVLRVPVLYGQVENLEESAVTTLLKFVLDKKPVEIDDWQARYPTLVDDVASVCLGLSERKLEHCGLYGTWHMAGPEKFTKYQIAVELAKIFELPHDHIVPTKIENPKVPHDAQLNCVALDVMGLRKKTPFAKGIRPILEPWVTKK